MEKQAELIREKDELDRLMAEMKLEDEDQKRWYVTNTPSAVSFSRDPTLYLTDIDSGLCHTWGRTSPLSSQPIFIYFGP